MSQSVMPGEDAALVLPVKDELLLSIHVSVALSTSAEEKLQSGEVITKPKASLETMPPELQVQVFEPLLAVQPGLTPPALLFALKPLPRLYGEAQRIYKSINYVITIKNQKDFIHMPMQIRMKIHHVVIYHTSSEGKTSAKKRSDFINLSGARAFGSNDFISITADFTHDKHNTASGYESVCLRSQVATSIGYMALASASGVKMIRVVHDTKDPQAETKYHQFVTQELDKSAGNAVRGVTFVRRKVQALLMEPTRVETIGELKVATWEKDSDVIKKFSLRPEKKNMPSRELGASL
ncbi:hypothetical protein QTJ16_000591 [Diplocarpon rosae]|uniref:Uncharacterized protein n=1 Tax=Diplocarpon rosae TaxID=946125 RepID=A0AAD9T5Y5_9HELO|nr:hypothetical protein QTJ16_000591 [Diplocarpon rosae]